MRQGGTPGAVQGRTRSPAWRPGGPGSRSIVLLVVGLLSLSSLVVPLLAVAPPARGDGSSPTASPSVTHVLTASPTSGPVGTNISFSASGFAHNSPFTVTWTDSAKTVLTACSLKTSSTGTATCHYLLPPTGAGAYTFTGKDGAGHIATASFTVVSSLVDTPSSGTVGTVVVVTGYGFTPTGLVAGSIPVPVNVTWLGSLVCPAATTKTSTLGSFTCGFNLPPSPSGGHDLVAVDSKSLSASVVFTVLPHFVIAPRYAPAGPAYGPVGSTVRLSGTGFLASAPVSVSWPAGTACSTTSLANGTFACSYRLLAGVSGGNYTFRATDGVDNGTFPFVVTYLNATPLVAAVGATVRFAGGGFTPNASYSVSWLHGPASAGSTGASGTISPFSFKAPLLAAGSYPFVAADSGGRTATGNLTIVPSLTAYPLGGPPGSRVTLNGSGFAADSTVTVSWANGTACSTTTNASGWFSCSFQFGPSVPGGPYVFSATDAASNVARTLFTVTYVLTTPSATADGATVALVGGGFSPNAPLTLTVGGRLYNSCAASTGPTGAFSCSLQISGKPAGPLAIVASTTSGTLTLTAGTTLLIVPHLTVNPSGGGVVGASFTFSGTGFAGLAGVTVSWGTGAVCAAETSGVGSFNCTLHLPPTPAGVHAVIALDAAYNYAQTTLKVTPALTVLPANGTVGRAIALDATGFAALSPIALAFSLGSSVGDVCSGVTDPGGSFNCTYTIPPSENGNISALGFNAVDGSGNRATTTFQVYSQLSVSPSFGPVGSILTFSGTGFGASVTVNVSWARGLACSVTSSSVGSFSCNFALPPTPQGGLLFSALEIRKSGSKFANLTAETSFTVVPHVSLNATSGKVGETLALLGTGFAANAAYTVAWPTSTLCSGMTSVYGSFSCPLTVPASTAGSYRVLATAPGGSAATFVRVEPALSIAPTSGLVGSNITLAGSGFAGASTVDVTWSGGTICSLTTDALGSFVCPAVMPPATGGLHTFNATDAVGDRASAGFTVTTSAGLSVTPSGGPPGTTVTFSGTAFAGSTTVTVVWEAGTPACSGTSDGSGSFSCSFVIPLGTPGGIYSFTGSDDLGHSATATFDVTFLTAAPTSGPDNTSVTFSAGGFAPNSRLDVNWSGGTACSGMTGSSGTFSCTVTLTAPAPGLRTFTASDARAAASATFLFVPHLAVAPPQGSPGSSVAITGTGYTPSSSYTVLWDGTTICSGTTGSGGRLACAFDIPHTVEGAHGFTATDAAGASASASYVVEAQLLASPAAGPVGTVVTFVGSGFAAGVSVSVNGSAGTVCGASTGARGDFNCTATVGPSAAGAHVYSASEGGPPVTTGTFTVTPKLTVTPNTGRVGTTLTFQATGFASQVGIQVDWLGGVACTGHTQPTGSFGCSFPIPSGLAGGEATFTAVDAVGNRASVQVLVIAALSASPDFGGPGTTTTFSGVGFAPSSLATVTWSAGPACSGTTSTTGAFACSFQIPLATPGGSYVFVATDAAGGSASTTFVVTFLSVAPLNGSVGTPLTLTAGGFSPTSPFTITWSGGTACSGVTDPSGGFRCRYVLTEASLGVHVFTATDGSGDIATASFTVRPGLSVAPGSATAGATITLTGTGFPIAAAVTVTWSGGGTVCSGTANTSGSIVCSFVLPSVAAGTYTFTAADPSSDTAITTLEVLAPTYAVTFTEAGLPSGSSWTVTVDGVSTSSTTSTIVLTEGVGTYSFSDAAAGFTGGPRAGTFSVVSGAVGVTITFVPYRYPVTFDALGLAGQSWSVTLGSVSTGSTTLTTTGANLTFDEPNGTYSYLATASSTFRVSAASGTVTVDGGAPSAITLTFTLVTYTLWVNETKLPAGKSWSVTVNGVSTSSSSPSIKVELANGSYNWVAKAAGFVATPASGVIDVSGAAPTPIAVDFAGATYTLTFRETGLSAGTAWPVTLGSGSPHSSNTTSLSLTVANGSYAWKTAVKGYRATPASGTVTVSGSSPANITIKFTQVTYTLTFNETGLPKGDYWVVLVSGGAPVNATTSSIPISEPNGTYTVLFGAPPGYAPTPLSTTLTVAGKNKAFVVSFSSTSTTPTGFLGLSGSIANYALYGTIGGAAAAAGGVGYYLARRGGPKKGLASDFL